MRARSQDLDAIWRGFYIAGDPALAYGYAQDQEPDARGRIRNGALLRVYVPRSSLPGFYRTGSTLAAPEAAGEVERLIGHPLPLRLDAITGPEEEGGRLETILGWPLAERTVVIPRRSPPTRATSAATSTRPASPTRNRRSAPCRTTPASPANRRARTLSNCRDRPAPFAGAGLLAWPYIRFS